MHVCLGFFLFYLKHLNLTCLSFPVLPNVCLMPVCRMLEIPSMLKRCRTHTYKDIVTIITNYQFIWQNSFFKLFFSRFQHGIIVQFIVYIASTSLSHRYAHISSVTESKVPRARLTALRLLLHRMERKSIRQFLFCWIGLHWAVTVHRWWVTATL